MFDKIFPLLYPVLHFEIRPLSLPDCPRPCHPRIDLVFVSARPRKNSDQLGPGGGLPSGTPDRSVTDQSEPSMTLIDQSQVGPAEVPRPGGRVPVSARLEVSLAILHQVIPHLLHRQSTVNSLWGFHGKSLQCFPRQQQVTRALLKLVICSLAA